MLQIRSVNKKLAEKGYGAYELVKGEGYFWVDGPMTEHWKQVSIMVHSLNQMTMDQWIDAIIGMIEQGLEDINIPENGEYLLQLPYLNEDGHPIIADIPHYNAERLVKVTKTHAIRHVVNKIWIVYPIVEAETLETINK